MTLSWPTPLKRYKKRDYEDYLRTVRLLGHRWSNASIHFPERTYKTLETSLCDAARRLQLVFTMEDRGGQLYIRFIGNRTTFKRAQRRPHDGKRKKHD